MSKRIEEKRTSGRKHIRVQITVHDGEGFGDIYFESNDLSSGGIFVISDILLDIGERLTLEFMLSNSSKPVHVEGEVVRIIKYPKQYGENLKPGMGIRFTNIVDEDKKNLEKFLRSME